MTRAVTQSPRKSHRQFICSVCHMP
jgi:hypothetical protein